VPVRKETGDFVTAIVFPFHRAGYCNSTALVEAKPRARILSYMSLPPFTFLLPSSKGPIGDLITQYYASQNV